MSKKLNDWLDEFVENGASPNRVTEWPDEAGRGGTTVVANPELEGTEPDLTGLEVDGTKYKVPVPPTPVATKLYTHMYGVKGNDRNMVFTLLRSDDTELTVQEVIDKLQSLGCAYYGVGNKEASIMYPASGIDYGNKQIIGVSVSEEYGQKQLVFIDSDFNPSTTLASALSFDIHVVAQL